MNEVTGRNAPLDHEPEELAGGQVRILERQTVWQGFVRLSRLVVEMPSRNGAPMQQVREVHDHGNAAVVLPIDPIARTVLLVRQWRIPPLLNGDVEPLLEAVAGIIDPGETPEQAAQREALEETGHEVRDLRKITAGYSSPGTLTEFFHLYAGLYDADSRRHDGGGIAHEGEDIEVVELGFDELRQMLARGEIRDAKTFIALTWALGEYA